MSGMIMSGKEAEKERFSHGKVNRDGGTENAGLENARPPSMER